MSTGKVKEISKKSHKYIASIILDKDETEVTENDLRELNERGVNFSKQKATEGKEAIKSFSKTKQGKKIVFFAVFGAIIAIPTPIVGPVFGAVVGASLGFYQAYIGLNASRASVKSNDSTIYDDLLKLGELRDKGVISEEEFKVRKASILDEISA